MTSDFRVSVIVPTYNYGRFLAETLDSVFRQTVPAHEVIVVDDGSTDDTPAVAARYGERVVYLRQPNRGVAAARNAGVDRATGDWLAFLDADDLWEPDFLARVRPECTREPRPVIVFTDFRTFGAAERVNRPSERFARWDPAAHVLVPYVSVMPSAAVVDRTRAARFPVGARVNEDAVFFNDTAARGPVRCVPEVLMRYRKHPQSAQARHQAGNYGDTGDTLLNWAQEREAANPGTVFRLLSTLADLVLAARWKRDWNQYHTLRQVCNRNWPKGVAKPAVLREWVWPQFVYRLRDRLGS